MFTKMKNTDRITQEKQVGRAVWLICDIAEEGPADPSIDCCCMLLRCDNKGS